MKPRQSVRTRLMDRQDVWVPYSSALARELVARCKTIAQKAAVQALLVLWQEQQADRREPSWNVVAGARTLARALDVQPTNARRMLADLVRIGILEETDERAARGAHVMRIIVRVPVAPGRMSERSAMNSDRVQRAPHNGTLQGAEGTRTPDATGCPGHPDEDAVRVPVTPPSRFRSSAPPSGQSRAELQKRERERLGPGRVQLRLRLFANLKGGRRAQGAQELLEIAERGGVDMDWQRRAESVLGGEKGGGSEERAASGEVAAQA